MAKMRGIKPDFWTDSKVASVSPVARLLFIGMWTWACDNGHLDNDAMQLKMRVFPADAITVAEVEAMVGELVGVGLVARGDGWLKVVRLSDHQKVDLRYLVLCDQCVHDEHSKWTHSDRVERTRGAHRVPSGQPAGTHRAPYDEGEGEGEGEKKHSLITAATNDDEHPADTETKTPRASAGEHPRFAEFWNHYPRKRGKGAARAAFAKAIKKGTDPDDILNGLHAQLATLRAKDEQYRPHASTWLNESRWEDEDSPPTETTGDLWNIVPLIR